MLVLNLIITDFSFFILSYDHRTEIALILNMYAKLTPNHILSSGVPVPVKTSSFLFVYRTIIVYAFI